MTGMGTLALVLAACGGSGGSSSSTPGGGGTSTLSASLMDSPFRTSGGTVTAVNIAISKVEAIGNGAPQIIATFSPAMPVNLMNYATSPLQLGTGTIPAGTYQQLRLVLDTSSASNTTAVINGTTVDLTIPSATGPSGFSGGSSSDNSDGPGTSGIKVNVNFTANAGGIYGFLIDFNAAESIVQAGGSGQYLMKPVIVATAQNVAGSIAGKVVNNASAGVANAEVLAEQNGTIMNSGVTDSNGNFQINALPAGTYTLVVNNTWTNQAGQAQTATGADGTAAVTDPTPVTVTAGQTTTGISITD